MIDQHDQDNAALQRGVDVDKLRTGFAELD